VSSSCVCFQGPDAGALLDRLSTAAVDFGVLPGTITYTQWLNPAGGLEADLTVTKLPGGANDGFLVVATDTAHRHVESRLQRYIRGHGDDPAWHGKPFAATVCDVSSGVAQLNLQGPDSRRILAAATATGSRGTAGGVARFGGADVSDAAFPFRACCELSVGVAPVLASRITYVGELGYELFVDAAQVRLLLASLTADLSTHTPSGHFPPCSLWPSL
jgi:4-methylaminobutanoate oxidase (formaldehyde-forming)